MAFVHGKETQITVATKDLSLYTDDSEFKRGASTHQVTTYGKQAEVHQGGLKKYEFTMSGTYDNTALNSPRAVLAGQEGNTLAIIRKPEGTGTGKPNEAFSGVLEEYVETNPVSEMVKWSAKFKVSDTVTTTSQA